jgi:hypothetical protein
MIEKEKYRKCANIFPEIFRRNWLGLYAVLTAKYDFFPFSVADKNSKKTNIMVKRDFWLNYVTSVAIDSQFQDNHFSYILYSDPFRPCSYRFSPQNYTAVHIHVHS